jgi:TolA-binding protein
MNASRLVVLSIALSPAILLGQKKEDLASIQRDVASMDDHVRQLQKTFDDKMTALMAMLQQSIDASNKTAATVAAMQHSLDQKFADQQTKLVAPMATLGTKVDDMSNDFRTFGVSMAELVRHMNDMDAKIKDISDAVRTLGTAAAPPPPAPAGTATQVPAADAPPAGWNAELAYTTAYRDYMGKRDDAAIEEFAKFVKYAPQSEHAPDAQYYIGQIYYRGQDYKDAVQAFDAVLEQFPANPKTADAQYFKACALMKNDQKTDAGREFRDFIQKFPNHPKVPEARNHLVELGMATKRPRK